MFERFVQRRYGTCDVNVIISFRWYNNIDCLPWYFCSAKDYSRSACSLTLLCHSSATLIRISPNISGKFCVPEMHFADTVTAGWIVARHKLTGYRNKCVLHSRTRRPTSKPSPVGKGTLAEYALNYSELVTTRIDGIAINEAAELSGVNRNAVAI